MCISGVVACNDENFYRDYRKLFYLDINLKLVFNGVISLKIKHFKKLFMKLFNEDFPVYNLGAGPQCPGAGSLGDPQVHVSLCRHMIRDFILPRK